MSAKWAVNITATTRMGGWTAFAPAQAARRMTHETKPASTPLAMRGQAAGTTCRTDAGQRCSIRSVGVDQAEHEHEHERGPAAERARAARAELHRNRTFRGAANEARVNKPHQGDQDETLA